MNRIKDALLKLYVRGMALKGDRRAISAFVAVAGLVALAALIFIAVNTPAQDAIKNLWSTATTKISNALGSTQ
jgi:hypothetical protein